MKFWNHFGFSFYIKHDAGRREEYGKVFEISG